MSYKVENGFRVWYVVNADGSEVTDHCGAIVGYYETIDDAFPIVCGKPHGHTDPHREPSPDEL